MNTRIGRRWLGTALLTLATLLTGCASVTVSSVSPIEYLAQRRGDVLTTGRLGLSSQSALHVIGSDDEACLKDAAACREALAASSGLSDEQRLSTLSEVWLHTALAQDKQPDTPASAALDAWLETARYAYAYLFFTAREPGRRAFEDRQTQVRDYYNYAVQQAVTRLFRVHRWLPGYPRRNADAALPSEFGGWHLSSDVSQLRLPKDVVQPEDIIPASSLRFSGLRNTYRRDGFGTELVAVMPAPARPAGPDAAEPPPYSESRFPVVTALLQFGGATLAEVLATRDARVVVHDPYRSSEVRIAGQPVPLAADFTAGYGLWLARSGFATQALRTLFGRDGGLDRPHIHLMQPYDPGRRTIVMLHGLASSPEAWVNVANEVLGDDTLRQRFQIWQVYYPTNAPLAVNQQAIREALLQTMAHFDPAGTAAASHDMVLIGHSMGGVLSRLLVSRADERLWQAVLPDAAELLLKQQSTQARQLREQLSPYLGFEPMPQVGTAIFIAAPHRGTPFANNRLSRRVANLITLPFAVAKRVGDLALSLAKLRPPGSDEAEFRIPNSIDQLSDRDSFVMAAAQLPIGQHVRFHSIIGDDAPGGPPDVSSDGIVPYASAHLEGARSELVIPSGHSVQEHPRAILEIRRILREQTVPRARNTGGGT